MVLGNADIALISLLILALAVVYFGVLRGHNDDEKTK